MRNIKSLLAALLVFSIAVLTPFTQNRANAGDNAAPLTGHTSAEIVSMMGLGYNIGNTFDATGGTIETHERAWGNVPVTQDFVDAVYEAGFDTVRLPITWMDFVSKDGLFTIDPAYLARVKEVVDYCYNDGLFVIINLHHESWVNRADFDTAYQDIAPELAALWTQIATYFADYDQHLIFEGMNEPRMAGTAQEWSGNYAAYEGVNYLNQIFVNAVLSTGLGHNSERALMIPGYAAGCSANLMKAIAMPTYRGQSLQNNLIVSVHSYTPYEFCLQDVKKTFRLDNTSDTCTIDYVLRDINEIFLKNGIPVIIGETGATNSGNNTAERANWAYYMSEQSNAYGVPIILWDNGSKAASGGECHGYINRATCQIMYPEIFEALQNGQKAQKRGSARQTETGAPEGNLLDGRTIWADADGLKAKKEWDATYIQFNSDTSFYPKDGKIAVVYKGSGSPQLVLDSEVRTQWWMPVIPSSTEKVGDYRVAFFTTAKILETLSGYGITETADLRFFSVVSTGPAITTYEIDVFGDAPATVLTFKVNGRTVNSDGVNAPKAPAFEGMEFAGWYTTPNFLPGTEFAGKAPDGIQTVYGKLGLKSYVPIATDVTPAAVPVIVPLSERKPTPTPTPTPVITEAPTPTTVITEAPSPTFIPTPAPETVEEMQNPGNSSPWFFVVIGISALIVLLILIICIVKQVRKRN